MTGHARRRHRRPLRHATRARTVSPRRPLALLALAALALVAPALAAQEPDAPCTPAGSALCVGESLASTLLTLDARLDRRHAALVRLVRGDDATDDDVRITRAVEALHPEWRRLRGADCELHGALTRAGGTWPTTWATDCEVAATRTRLATVDATIRCIEALPPARRADDRFDCLARLRLLTAATRRAGPG